MTTAKSLQFVAEAVERRPLLLGLAVLLMAGATAALAGFDGLYGQDPFAYYAYATGPLRQSLLDLTPAPAFFWPPGYPFAVALVSLAVGPTALAGQVVSLMAGALVPVLTSLLAREVWMEHGTERDPSGSETWLAPLVAGLVVAFNGQLWHSSMVVMSDTLALAAATLGVLALVRYSRLGRPQWLLLAAAALASAIVTRWIYGLVAVPCAVYVLLALARRSPRVAALHGLSATCSAGLVLGPVLVPALASLASQTHGLAAFAGNWQVLTWHPFNAFQREFTTVDGHLAYALPNGLYYALAPAHRFFFTPLLAPLVLPGLVAAVRSRSPAALLLILGWVATIYGFHAGSPLQNLRFTLAYLPPLAVLVGIGSAFLYGVAGRRSGLPLGLYLTAGLGLMAAGGVVYTQDLIERKNHEVATVRWVEANAPRQARLLTFGLTLTFQHYSHIETLELFDQTQDSLASMAADDRPTFLLLDVANVEQQWRWLSPSNNYHWLRDQPGLRELGQRGAYTLFRVGAGPP